MTKEEAAQEMVLLREMMLFDPMHGRVLEPSDLNRDNQRLYEAAGVALSLLRAVDGNEDTRTA